MKVTIAPPPPAFPAYDVVIAPGLAVTLDALLRAAAPAPHYAIIADARVARLYGEAVVAAVRRVAPRVELLELPSGERSKTRETWSALTDALLMRGLGRDGCIIALGGGVTLDVAGFVAATYMRGIACVHVPTSLLAMVDAAIGGKTGVDTPGGKNLVGAFLQPRLVVVDPRLLATLPDAQLHAGLAEAVKHGAIADEVYLRGLRSGAAQLHARDERALTGMIHRSVEIKAAVVARDPDERGERASLNFGHTVAHALERLSDYTIPHGLAVASGLVVEAELGELMGVTRPGTADALRNTLRALGLPDHVPERVAAHDLLAAAATDKKARRGRLRVTLLRGIGEVACTPEGEWTFAVDSAALTSALARTLLADGV